MENRMSLTENELDKILEELPTYWKEVGEKKFSEDAYRYLMKHGELLETDEGRKTYDYLENRVVQIWCKETNTEDETWIRKFIKMIFSGQNKSTPSMAERGESYAKFLINQFKKHPKIADYLMESK